MDWGWCVRISWRRGWVSAVCCVLVTHLTRKMKNLVTLAVVLLMVCFKNIWRLCSPCWRWENYCSCSADISWKRSKHPEQSRGKLNKSILRQSLSIRRSINRSLIRLSLMFGQWTCNQRCTLHKQAIEENFLNQLLPMRPTDWWWKNSCRTGLQMVLERNQYVSWFWSFLKDINTYLDLKFNDSILLHHCSSIRSWRALKSHLKLKLHEKGFPSSFAKVQSLEIYCLNFWQSFKNILSFSQDNLPGW